MTYEDRRASANERQAFTGKDPAEVYFGTEALFGEIVRPPPWRELAACAGMDPALFFPERGANTEPAKQVCARCPVIEECADFAIEHRERYGIWGGMSERQRRQTRSV